MKRKGLVVLFGVALIATNVYLSVQLYSANQQIIELTRDREKFMKVAESLATALSTTMEIHEVDIPGNKE